MVKRSISEHLQYLSQHFPVLTLTGPRQSGKTTLLRHLFPDHTYLNLEALDIRAEAEEDPRGFLRHHAAGAILDEAQRVPDLFSYVQTLVDESGEMGRIILSGSQNFLLMDSISQSLAGRAAIQHLLPFSITELPADDDISLDERLLQGSYPPIYDRQLKAAEFYPSYLETYVERDVRSLRNIGNLTLFRKFLMLCAGRSGQLLNLTALGNEVGVDHKTIQSWISVLEAGFLVYRLPPYYKNWNKRLVKQSKLFFLDTGLLCSLLGIRKTEDLRTHPLRGAIFESWVVAEAVKSCMNQGRRPSLYFWRDHSGHEIDLLIEDAGKVHAIEVKSGETINSNWLDALKWFQALAPDQVSGKTVIYGGTLKTSREAIDLIPWHESASALNS